MEEIQDKVMPPEKQGPIFMKGEELIIKGGRFKVLEINKFGLVLRGQPSGASWARRHPRGAMRHVAECEWKAARQLSPKKMEQRLRLFGVNPTGWSTTAMRKCVRWGIFEAYKLRAEQIEDAITAGGPDTHERIKALMRMNMDMYPFKDYTQGVS